MITMVFLFHFWRFPYEPPPPPSTPCGKAICYLPRPVAERSLHK